MTAIPGPFGLLGTLDFGDVANSTLVEGQTRLATFQGGPEGMLFKRVANFQEAVDAGGLFLWAKTDPTKWMFIIGNTLTRVLADSKLGIVSTIVSPTDLPDGKMFKYKNKPKYAGLAHGDRSNGIRVFERVNPSGDFQIILGDKPYFGDVAVSAMAVVTGADEGFGISIAQGLSLKQVVNGLLPFVDKGVGMGYAASLVPMNAPFSQFMTSIKAALLLTAPSNIRTYYDRTFDAVNAAYSDKALFPTISVNTHWEGSALVNPTLYEPALVDLGSTTASNPVIGVTADAALPLAGYTVTFLDGGNIDSVSGGIIEDASTKYRLVIRPGFRGAGDSTHPLMETTVGYSIAHPITSPTGDVDQMKVGILRDGHVLKRSIIEATRFATVPSSHATLADMVNSTIDAYEFDQGAIAAESTLTQALAQAQVLQTEEGVIGNIFQVGSLPIHITRFSNAWDEAAMALADQEN